MCKRFLRLEVRCDALFPNTCKHILDEPVKQSPLFPDVPTPLQAILNVFCWHKSGCYFALFLWLVVFSGTKKQFPQHLLILAPGKQSWILRNQTNYLYQRWKGLGWLGSLTSAVPHFWLPILSLKLRRALMRYKQTVWKGLVCVSY